MREPGVRVVGDAPGLEGYRGVFLLRLGEGCLIGAPSDVVDRVRTGAEGQDPRTVFTRESARELVGDDASLVLGPSIHAYVDASTFVPHEPGDARLISAGDHVSVDRLRASVDDDQWGEGGFAPEAPYADVLWGAFEDGELVAAGNMTDFDGRPADVGIVTHPGVRGRGVATRLAGAMVEHALRTIDVIRYRALETNAASLRVAQKLGFVPDGANIAVRLRT